VSREPSVPRPPGASRYGWAVGVLVVLILAYITLNTFSNDDEGSSTGPKLHQPMPPFAVPLATSDLDGDANVATKGGQGDAGNKPACQVRGPDILNICQLYERGPVALAFLATRGGRCVKAVDQLDDLRAAYPKVQFAVIAIRGDRGDLRDTIRERGWRLPVGYDRDGILANLYGVAVCPQITLADQGGRVRETVIGETSTAELRRKLDALARPAR
jgi:hypothetical protein